MKHVFETSEIAHIWAAQSQTSAKNSGGNFYFENATIYSYGRHFPIATIEGNDVLFTLSKYSNTTAKHINRTYSAVSHKNIIYCKDVPVKHFANDKPLNKQSFSLTHESNINYWKTNIKRLFAELGNKKNRDTQGRINAISREISQITAYCSYFKIKMLDKELQAIFSDIAKPAFVEIARKAAVKVNADNEKKMKFATKAYETYIELWRKYDSEGLENLPSKTKELCNYYANKAESFTRLRYNAGEKRLETSKGVQIPVAIAKKAYTTLNGCMEGKCDSLEIPVLNYTITKTTAESIIAGCHTIPKEDVRYIANLLKW